MNSFKKTVVCLMIIVSLFIGVISAFALYCNAEYNLRFKNSSAGGKDLMYSIQVPPHKPPKGNDTIINVPPQPRR